MWKLNEGIVMNPAICRYEDQRFVGMKLYLTESDLFEGEPFLSRVNKMIDQDPEVSERNGG